MKWIRSLWNGRRKEKKDETAGGCSLLMACTTHVGRIRIGNEDNFFFEGRYMPQEHQSLDEVLTCRKSLSEGVRAALFDGMGGECSGEVASYTAAETFASLTDTKEDGEWTKEDAVCLIRMLNRAICEKGAREKVSQMGTTAIILCLGGGGSWIANLGDSPAYRYRDGDLEMLTCMHTNAELFKECGITNRKPGLTQFLGISEEEFQVEPHVRELELQKGDIYLLCSDGLTDMVQEEEIASILVEEKSVEEKTRSLLELALAHGGRDNITIIICQIIWQGGRDT